MSKYNEVMDNLVVTEDMRKRLLANVEKEMSEAKASEKENGNISEMPNKSDNNEKLMPSDENKPEHENKPAHGNNTSHGDKRRILEFRRYAGIAAAFAVLIVGAYAVSKAVPFSNNNSMSATSSYDAAKTETAIAPEAEYVTEAANEAEEYAMESAAEEAYDSDSEPMGTMAAGTYAAAEDEAMVDSDAVIETEALAPQTAVKEVESSGKTSNASLESSKFSIFKIFGKNGGEKSEDIKEYSDIAELSKTAMTEFDEIEYFDSFSSSKEYHLYDGKVALIYYDVSGNDVVVKEMSTKKGASIPAKVSGITADMGSTSSITVGKVDVTLKGNDDTYSIATWTTGGLVYELESSELLTYEDMKALMEEIINQ